MKFLVGLILGLLVIPVWGLIYFHWGHPPVAVGDAPFPLERQLVHAPLHARIDREMPSNAPIEASATNLTAGRRSIASSAHRAMGCTDGLRRSRSICIPTRPSCGRRMGMAA